MATIKDTLADIEDIQDEIVRMYKDHKASQFLEDILNFTTVLWFELASHACLDSLSNHLAQTDNSRKYLALRKQQRVLDEYIRWMNIGGLLIIWNIYERYIRSLQLELFRSIELDIPTIYTQILKERGIKDRQLASMICEFEAIRKTRNALHQGGIYSHKKIKKYLVRGQEYILEQGKPVKPFRLMLVIRIFVDHFKSIEKLEI